MLHQAHAATGALAGAGLVTAWDLFGADLPPETYPVYALACAGWALAPDLDHDGSAFTRSGGPATRILAETLQWVARFTYRHTRRECDPPTHVNKGEHRGLLHTFLFPLAVGVLVAWASTLHQLVGMAVLTLVLSPGLRSVAYSTRHVGSPKTLASRSACLAASFAIAVQATFLFDVALSGPLFGAVAAVGMWTHIAGDGITSSGVPWLGGIPHRCDKHRAQRHTKINGRYRKPTRRCAMWDTSHNVPRRWIRRTGHKREHAITAACLAGSATLVAAGVTGIVGALG